MFNIFFNDLFLIQLDSNLSAYADDTQLFCTGIDSNSVYQGMSVDLLTVAGWLRANDLAVNGDKCLSMWLGSITTNPSYYFDNHEIRLDQIQANVKSWRSKREDTATSFRLLGWHQAVKK